MNCRDCPYGEEDFNRRMYWYLKTISERGIPNDIYHYLIPEDAPDEFEQFLWCDKVGGKVFWAGRCSDVYSEQLVQTKHISSKKKRRDKRERDLKHKRHLKRLWDAKKKIWSPPVLYVDYVWEKHEMLSRDKPYYKRLTPLHGGKYRRDLKRQSRKQVRHYKGTIPNGGGYKKIFDYQWESN